MMIMTIMRMMMMMRMVMTMIRRVTESEQNSIQMITEASEEENSTLCLPHHKETGERLNAQHPLLT